MTTFIPKRDGDLILVIVPNYWAKAPTFPEAAAQLRREGGGTITERTPESRMLVYSVHPKTYCEEVRGDLIAPKDHKPIRLKRQP